jgi:hypothetical protein
MGIFGDALRTSLERNFGILGRAIADGLVGANRTREPEHAYSPDRLMCSRVGRPTQAVGPREVIYQVEDGHSWTDVHTGYDVGQAVGYELDSIASRYPQPPRQSH